MAGALALLPLASCGPALPNTAEKTQPTPAPVAAVVSTLSTPFTVSTATIYSSATPTVVIPGMPSCLQVPDPGQADAQPTATVEENTPLSSSQPTGTSEAIPSHAGKIVAIDPGHGGRETGAESNAGLIEKNVNLKIGLKLAALLKQGGYTPVLTRNADSQVNVTGKDLNGNGVVDTDDDLQARVDVANAAHADVLVSLHNDSSTDPAAHGTTTYYCDTRPFADENRRLAADLQSHLVASIRAAGYNTLDKGTSDDAPLKKPFGHLFVLGPLTPRVARASSMPGALGETLYLSNPREAALLADDKILSAIAEGYYQGLAEYLGR
ncbi:MAG: N-acetylmuramoyl-L-alanine amidase [Chloroflexota bacterium]|nr:N-acetylmuramoyl-L-alanine amidase [Chloroflexota bacterium]